jgi:hypothetical protein
VATGGVVASALGAADGDALAAAGLTGGNVTGQVTAALIARLADQAAAGTLAVDVTPVLPLDRATDGLRQLAKGEARARSSSRSPADRAGRGAVSAGSRPAAPRR